MMFAFGHNRFKKRRKGGRRSDVSHGRIQSDTDRVNESDPIDIQIQISDDVTNETEEESKVCEDEINVEIIEKETSTDDVF